MHKCITLLRWVWLSLPLYFSLLVSSPPYSSFPPTPLIGLLLSPTVSIQWMEQGFFIFSLVPCTAFQFLEVEARLQRQTLPLLPHRNYWQEENKLWDTHTKTKKGTCTLQVQALCSLSGRQEIRGLLLVFVFNHSCWTGSDCLWRVWPKEGQRIYSKLAHYSWTDTMLAWL